MIKKQREDIFHLGIRSELICLKLLQKEHLPNAIPADELKSREDKLLEKVESVGWPFLHRQYMGQLEAIRTYRRLFRIPA